LWCSLPGTYVAEVVAGSGFDWLLFDTEHSPGDPLTVLAQLQAVAPYPVSAVLRPASNDTVLIKRFLDIGAQTLLVPCVQNAAEAAQPAAGTRYPAQGVRGVSGVTRATRFGRVQAYARRAADELCLLVQVETREALDQLKAIAGVEAVDGVFIGPADLPQASAMPASPVIWRSLLPSVSTAQSGGERREGTGAAVTRLVSALRSTGNGRRLIATVDLDRRVGEPEALAQARLDGLEHAMSFRVCVKPKVERRHGALGRERPEMDVVDLLDSRDGADQIGAYLARVHPLGGALHEDVPGVTDERVGALQDEQCDQHRQDRIDRRPAGQQNDDGGGERGGRPEKIAEHVQERAC